MQYKKHFYNSQFLTDKYQGMKLAERKRLQKSRHNFLQRSPEDGIRINFRNIVDFG
jgi:hypothetical protein